MTKKYFAPGTFLLLAACFILPGCSPSAESPGTGDGPAGTEKTPPVPEPPREPNPELEKLVKNIQPEGTQPAAAEEKPQAEEKPANKPPERVVSPPPAPPEPGKTSGPPEGTDEKELLDSLKNSMILLGRAFESGEREAVAKFLVVDNDLKAILTGGGYSILGISLEAQNGEAVTQTLKAIKEKKIEHEFVPGQITYTPNSSIFKKQIPTMSKSKLLFRIDGTPVPFIFYIKQLVWLDKGWKIFNAAI